MNHFADVVRFDSAEKLADSILIRFGTIGHEC